MGLRWYPTDETARDTPGSRFLAVTVADEARHVEVFTRRATMTGHDLALSTVGGRTSLQTLIDEPDYAIASFLLSVTGEGTFVSLLSFLDRHAPDPDARTGGRVDSQQGRRSGHGYRRTACPTPTLRASTSTQR
jgi:hypothetical protein